MDEKDTNKQEQLDEVVKTKIQGIGLDALFHLVNVSNEDDSSAPSANPYPKPHLTGRSNRLKSAFQFLNPITIKSRLKRIYSSKPNTILGLATDASGIKIMSMKEAKGTIQVDQAEYIPVPPALSTSAERVETFTVETLLRLLNPQIVKHAYICSIIPRSKVIIKFFSLPTEDPSEIEKMIEFEAEHYIPFNLHECVFDYDILYHKNGKSHIILATIKKDEINRHLQLLDKAGLCPSAIDISSLILHNTFAWEKYQRGRTLHICVGSEHTDINIIEDSELKISRGIPWGTSELIKTLSGKLNVNLEIAEKMMKENGIVVKKSLQNDISQSISEIVCQWAQNLITEIKETFRHFQYQEGVNAIDRILLTGEGSRLLNLDEYLKDQIKTQVLIQKAPKAIKYSSREGDYQKFYNELGFLTGLAGRFKPERSINVNLLPQDLRFTYEQKKRDIRQLVAYGIISLVCLGLLMLPAGILSARGRYMTVLDQEINTLKPKSANIQNLKNKIQTIEDYRSITHSCIEVLREITTLVSLDIIINRFSFEQNSSVVLVGEAESHTSVVNLSRAVRESDLFDDAILKYTRKNNRLEENVDFEIICLLSQ